MRLGSRVLSRSALLTALIVLLCDGYAFAACSDGAAPRYSDIEAVAFQRQGCGGIGHHPSILRCSIYSLVVWPERGIAEYDQDTLPGIKGQYKISISLSTLQRLLQRYDFFGLAPGWNYVTDINYTTLSVRRCGVITTISMFPVRMFDSRAYDLFVAIDALVGQAPKVMVGHNLRNIWDFDWESPAS